MGKRAEQTKKRKRLAGGDVHTVKETASLVTTASLGSNDTQLVSLDDIATTVLTLETLCEEADELARKDVKDVKRAVYALQRVMADGMTLGTSLSSRISSALQDYRFTDALILLFEMYTRKLPPKLGSLQRWVRECDATVSASGETRDSDAMKCLDLILRIANPASIVDSKSSGNNLIRRKATWSARGGVQGEIPIWERMQKGALFDANPPTPYPNFRPVQHTPGHLRKPPNVYDSTVYGSSPNAIVLSQSRNSPSRIDVPGLPGAFMVMDVFTPEECLQIAQAAEAIGFEKDEAAGGSATQKASILARNFVWLADEPFLDHFYSQILPFVPQRAPTTAEGNGGGAVRGINARFRVYQYRENQVYRPHIDGAWPAAGLDPQTGEYLHEQVVPFNVKRLQLNSSSSPPNDPLWSRYTLLVYLNSDVPEDTGATTFFLPASEIGVMEATSVRPIQGAVLCFPHGDTQGSLLHEGSAVGPNGGKLVIRTDLLYEAKGFGQYKPPPSVGVKQGGKDEEGLGG